jgi:hypothetical protein
LSSLIHCKKPLLFDYIKTIKHCSDGFDGRRFEVSLSDG